MLKLYENLKIIGGEMNELYRGLKEFRNLPFISRVLLIYVIDSPVRWGAWGRRGSSGEGGVVVGKEG